MMKIMFVCHGNICRSPMAEFIFKKIVYDAHREGDFFVSSSATSSEEITDGKGNPMYPSARRELTRHGIPHTDRCAVQLQKSDYDKYDMFVCMDSANVRNARRIFASDSEGKICRLLEFASLDRDVADPWYSDRFDIAYNDIYLGCNALFKSLINGKT